MTPTTEDETQPGSASGPSTASRTEAAASRLARLQGLRSAWGVLAPSALSEDGDRIAGIGRDLTARIDALGQCGGVPPERELEDIDRDLQAFETSIQAIAARVPVSQFRSTLPGHLPGNRQGLLDLLDILIGPEVDALEPAPCHLGAIDYLITLLCTRSESPLSAGGSIQHDPVTLTPRLASLSQHAEETAGERFTGVEAEFFIAAGMEGRDLREEFQHRILRSRKTELGIAFFVPGILRAIVTYNSALITRTADEIEHSGDWGFAGEGDGSEEGPGTGRLSVFDSEPLRQVIDSVRRRARGEAPRTTASDQIAWALDFDHLTKSERKALLTDRPGSREEPLCTAIVVGLICRSLAVLSVELQTLGIPPDDLADLWTDELGRIFQEEINRHISQNDYRTACSLSEVKNKFLSAPLADQFREQGLIPRPAAASATPTTDLPTDPISAAPPRKKKRESARDLIRSALDESIDERSGAGTRIGGTPWRWNRIGQAVALIALIAVGVGIGAGLGRSDRDLERWDRERLAMVSPHLLHGAQSDEGSGTAFVGTIDEAWLDLPPRERGQSAEDLVMRLRDLGLRQIMIYDEDDVLRIQAIGSQPIRML